MVSFVFILLGVHWTFWIYGFSFHEIGNIYSRYLTFFSVSSFLSSFRKPGYTYADCMVLPTWHCCSVYFCLVGTLCTTCCSAYCYVHKFSNCFCTVYSIDNPIWCICHFRSFSFSRSSVSGLFFHIFYLSPMYMFSFKYLNIILTILTILLLHHFWHFWDCFYWLIFLLVLGSSLPAYWHV